MKRHLLIACAALMAIFSEAQTINDIINRIEHNNTQLKASRLQNRADSLTNLTDLNLAGPDVEFNYLWGSPAEVGHRYDLRVTQTLDFPTLTGAKSRAAHAKNAVINAQYLTDRQALRADIRRLCIDIIYYNRLCNECQRQHNSAMLNNTYMARMLDKGEATQLDYNKALLNTVSTANTLERAQLERSSLLLQLQAYNGGEPINLTDTIFPDTNIPDTFEQYSMQALNAAPQLMRDSLQLHATAQEVSLARKQAWPELTVGYMRESPVGDKYQGLTIGLALPLWQNHNRVRAAKAQQQAAQAQLENSRTALHTALLSAYNRTLATRAIAQRNAQALQTLSNTALLDKALQKGAITITDYIVQQQLYFNAYIDLLTADRDYHQAYTDLISLLP